MRVDPNRGEILVCDDETRENVYAEVYADGAPLLELTREPDPVVRLFAAPSGQSWDVALEDLVAILNAASEKTA